MPIKGVGFTTVFLVWDVANDEPETGLDPETQLTIRLIRDGVASDATGAIAEVENGYYSIVISDAENDADSVAITGTCTVEDTLVDGGGPWTNTPHPLEGVLADLDDDEGSAAWAILTILKRLLGNCETTENAGGAVTEVFEGALGGTVRATSTVTEAGGVVTKEMS